MEQQAAETETQPENGRTNADKKFKIVSLGEWGPRLPLGTVDPASGKLIKDMAHRTWNLRREKQLGQMRDKERGINVARFASMVVACLYERLGTLTFGANEKRKEALKDLVHLGQMWMGDVLYSYIWLRRDVMGSELDVELTCPRCRNVMPFKADLDTLEVRTVEKLEDAYWTYTLNDPFEIRGKKAEALIVGPARWSAIESAVGSDVDTGGAKAELIISSIDKVVGLEDVVLTENELDEMSKLDLETLTAEIDVRHIGPDMAIDARCERCHNAFRLPIDWTYESFFGISGRSGP